MKRNKFEAGGNEDNYVRKCIKCRHSYTRRDEADMLFCGCRKGCNFEPEKAEKAGERHE